MGLRRTHVMIEPEQHKALAEIAKREGRSVSEVTREIVKQGIMIRQQQHLLDKQRRLKALERVFQIGEEIIQKRGGKPVEIDIVALINEMRLER